MERQPHYIAIFEKCLWAANLSGHCTDYIRDIINSNDCLNSLSGEKKCHIPFPNGCNTAPSISAVLGRARPAWTSTTFGVPCYKVHRLCQTQRHALCGLISCLCQQSKLSPSDIKPTLDTWNNHKTHYLLTHMHTHSVLMGPQDRPPWTNRCNSS